MLLFSDTFEANDSSHCARIELGISSVALSAHSPAEALWCSLCAVRLGAPAANVCNIEMYQNKVKLAVLI